MRLTQRAVDAIRWRWILARSDLDPGSLGASLEPPGDRDFVIAGCPRTGTSLVAGALFQPPRVLVSMEPWIGLRLPPDQLFLELRRQIAKGSMRGRLDLEKLEEGHIGWRQDAPTTLPFSVDDDFALGVKWPTFWQYLEHLPHTRFVITVRDPVDVVLSFARQSGSLRDGLDYDVPFNAAMNDELASATDDVELRRVLLYEYINSRLLPHLDRPNVFVVRYERWHRDPEQLIDDLSRFLEVDRLQLTVQIERAGPSEADRRTLDLVSTHAPSARALGYVL